MKISKSILAALLCVSLAACHEVEVPGGPSMNEFLTAHAWAQYATDLDGDDSHESGWVIKFNADGSFEDAGLHIDPAGGAATWAWNKAQTSVIITQDGDEVAQLNVVELSEKGLTYDQYVSFPTINSDHVSYYNSPVCGDAVDWAGTVAALENYYDGPILDDHYGPYNVTLVKDGTNPNKFTFNDFWDSGLTAFMIFDPTTNTVTFPTQTVGGKTLNGKGTFDACTGSFVIKTTYGPDEWNYVFVKP